MAWHNFVKVGDYLNKNLYSSVQMIV